MEMSLGAAQVSLAPVVLAFHNQSSGDTAGDMWAARVIPSRRGELGEVSLPPRV